MTANGYALIPDKRTAMVNADRLEQHLLNCPQVNFALMQEAEFSHKALPVELVETETNPVFSKLEHSSIAARQLCGLTLCYAPGNNFGKRRVSRCYSRVIDFG